MDTKHAWFLLAGVEAVLYSIFIWAVLSGNFTPNDGGSISVAIVSTARVLAVVACWTLLHVYVQIGLAYHSVDVPGWGWKAYDWATTVAPALSMAYTKWIHMAGMTPKVAWWTTFERSVWIIILLGIGADILYGIFRRR